jgi:hypothetical protein
MRINSKIHYHENNKYLGDIDTSPLNYVRIEELNSILVAIRKGGIHFGDVNLCEGGHLNKKGTQYLNAKYNYLRRNRVL